MIRIKPTRRFKVSNRLALVGALALSLTFFTGLDGMDNPATLGDGPAVMTAQAPESDDGDDPTRQGKKFSISRLLFGHG